MHPAHKGIDVHPLHLDRALVSTDPRRFFAPTTSSSDVFSGWLGIYLDAKSGLRKLGWREVSAIVEDACRNIAPNALVAELDSRRSEVTGAEVTSVP
jgi:hypothetical protein